MTRFLLLVPVLSLFAAASAAAQVPVTIGYSLSTGIGGDCEFDRCGSAVHGVWADVAPELMDRVALVGRFSAARATLRTSVRGRALRFRSSGFGLEAGPRFYFTAGPVRPFTEVLVGAGRSTGDISSPAPDSPLGPGARRTFEIPSVWSFTLTPAAGVRVRAGRRAHVHVAAGWTLTAAQGRFANSAGVTAGVGFAI